MSVHYKFKSALEYDTISFDGLHISIKDLKNTIIQQKRIGKNSDFDLQVTNAQTKEVYDDENALIPKNTSLLIARVPVVVSKNKQWDGYGGNDTPPTKLDDGGSIIKTADLCNLDASEEDKIAAMMSQSAVDYSPSNYLKIRGSNQMGPVPANYKCFKCHQGGHWIKDCPLGQTGESVEIKKSTGIPQSFMVPVDGPQVQGAMMTPNGQYAVPVLDHQAYTQKNPNPNPAPASKPDIPEDLLCSICSDLLTDAVMIPCCGNSFCDECIRSILLESEERECPDCHDKEICPSTLIPNRFLRKSVSTFKNTTGYEKKQVYRETKKTASSPADSTEKEKNKSEEEKTVISEADSTEHEKIESLGNYSKVDVTPPVDTDTEGPPGVSPSRRSPKHHISSKISSGPRENPARNSKYHDDSPRKISVHKSRRSPSYKESGMSEERSGTPTRDEPNGSSRKYPTPTTSSFSTATNTITPIVGVGGPPVQGIPGTVPPRVYAPAQPPVFPPNQGPPPNFRLPPPGAVPPYMPPGAFPGPQRATFDPRPPVSGPPPNFPPSYSGPRGRDFNRRMGDQRTPSGVIDDPLAAFNRMLRLKDERDRRKRNLRRSYSRSRSRSRSFSPSPRRRSRTPPRRRISRSRSRSPFSLSRSRSRSYSLSPRGSPYRPLSPLSRRSPLPPPRKGPARFRSPARSPPPRRHPEPKGRFSRERDYGPPPRDYDRNYRDKDRRDDRDIRDRDRDRFYDRMDDRSGPGGSHRPPPPIQPQGWQSRPEQAYYPPPASIQQSSGYQNRYPPRDYGPPPHLQPPSVKKSYEDDIGPPGVEQPPVPGLEPEQPSRFSRPEPKVEHRDKKSNSPLDVDREKRRRRTRSPEKWRNPSPKNERRRDDSGDRSRRRRRHSSSSPDDRKRDRDHSDDDRKRSKDKKKHKEKKESDKKKKRDRKDKHRKSDRDKRDKSKEEFKQIIPKNAQEDDVKPIKEDHAHTEESDSEKRRAKEISNAEIEAKNHKREEEEKRREEKRLEEEKKKEERKLRFLEEEKKLMLAAENKKREEEERIRRNQQMEKEQKSTIIPESPPLKQVEIDIFEHFEPVTEEIQNVEPEPISEEVKEIDEEECGILELHSTDIDLKAELDKSDILAHLPEKSKWEVDEEGQLQASPSDYNDRSDPKMQKVTNEVLKRAENAIFAKAINAIRPIEIKKISVDRAKLYSDEKEIEEPKRIDLTVEKPRLSVKERLGVKVEDTPRVVLVDRRHRSRTVSPFSRKERRLELDEYRRHERSRRSPSRRLEGNREKKKIDGKRTDDRKRRSEHKEKSQEGKLKHDDKRDKKKRSRSRSESEEKKKRKRDKKVKKEKKKDDDKDDKKDDNETKYVKSATAKRKPTLEEENFEPDYDLELHTDDDREGKKSDEKKEEDSSSSDSSSSSSEEERRKKKHRKHKKKKKRESSSSSSESESDSSDSEKEKKRRKHKKSKKKKKKSKHK